MEIENCRIINVAIKYSVERMNTTIEFEYEAQSGPYTSYINLQNKKQVRYLKKIMEYGGAYDNPKLLIGKIIRIVFKDSGRLLKDEKYVIGVGNPIKDEFVLHEDDAKQIYTEKEIKKM